MKFFPNQILMLIATVLVLCLSTSILQGQNREVREIMEYLESLPSRHDKRIISGQFERWGAAVEPLSSPTNFVNIVHQKTGKWVGLVGVEYHNGPRVIYDKPNQLCVEYWNRGGFCQLYLIMSNPANPEAHNGGGKCDIRSILDPAHPHHKYFFKELNEVADGLEDLQDKGVVIFINMFAEATGSWFWWGGGEPEDFIALYQATYDHLVIIRGLKNLIFVYEPSSHHDTALDYYPGPDYVDIIGISIFIDHDKELEAGSIPNYQALKALGKPMAFSQWGPRRGSDQTRTIDQPPADNLKLMRGIQQYFPDIVWWMNWCYAYSISTLENSNYNDTELLNHPWVINLGEIEIRE